MMSVAFGSVPVTIFLQVTTAPGTKATVPPGPADGVFPDLQNLDSACSANPSLVCENIFNWTGSRRWAGTAEWVVTTPLAILAIVLVALIVNRILRRLIRRGMQRKMDPRARSALRRATPSVLLRTSERSLRSEARRQTLTTVFCSLSSVFVWFVAVVSILQVLHLDLTPILFSSAVIGVALGFGAQNIVRDFLAGTFIVLEDQLGVGDIVDLGEAEGIVEQITLRATRLRDDDGTLWHVPNGQIQRVANKSQQWSRAVLDIEVDGGTDYEQAAAVMQEVAEGLGADEEWMTKITATPEVWGIESFTDKGYVIRLVLKTVPTAQFTVMRELRVRLVTAFQQHHILLPGDHPEARFRNGEPVASGPDDSP
jgi:small-conductance mechanosensitive channel